MIFTFITQELASINKKQNIKKLNVQFINYAF